MSRKRDMFQIQDIFENGKPDIVLEKKFKFGIVVFFMFNKMLVIVFFSTFTLDMGWDPKNPVFQFEPISNTQC